MSNLLIDEHPLTVSPSLAKEIGLNEALVLSFMNDVGRPVSASEINNSLGFLSLSTINRILSELKRLGMIDDVSLLSPFEVKAAVLTFKEEDKKLCEWCGGKSIVLHEHHFPLLKREGGRDTVSICPNCHYGYHDLESRRFSTK